MNRAGLLDVLEAHAQSHGRTLDAEIDLALAIHTCNHGIAMLQYEAGRAEAKRAGQDPESEAEEFKGELQRLCALAFEPLASRLPRGF